MKSRISYEVDSRNRLIASKTGNKTSLKKFRQVLEGSYKVDKKNRLYYEIKKPDGKRTPSKIKFTGKYRLDKNHNLILGIDRSNKKKLKLNTRLIGATGNKIAFNLSSDRVSFEGRWRADKSNRLTFRLKRENRKDDNLILLGAWNINKKNEIVYSADGRTEKVTFRGLWELTDKHRVRYSLDKKYGSGFDFKVNFGKIIPRDKKTYIDFDINIDISKRKVIRRRVSFECKTALGKKRRVILGVIPGSRRIRLRLDKKMIKPEGILFLESILNPKEKYIGGGVIFRW